MVRWKAGLREDVQQLQPGTSTVNEAPRQHYMVFHFVPLTGHRSTTSDLPTPSRRVISVTNLLQLQHQLLLLWLFF